MRGYIGQSPTSGGVYSLEEHYKAQLFAFGYSKGWTDYNGGFATASMSGSSLVITPSRGSYTTSYAGKERVVSLPMVFQLSINIAWTGVSYTNIGRFILGLMDSSDNVVIGAGYMDQWGSAGGYGTEYAFSGANIYGTAISDMPYSGSGTILITRTAAGLVKVYFNGIKRLEATNTTLIKGLLISAMGSSNTSYPLYGVTFGEILRLV